MNYIVSGLERSGTSMMMQILYRGGMKVAFDKKRKPDEHNPKGYFELEGGKIINRLIRGNFPISDYDGKVIKVTAYGVKYLPKGGHRYLVIYMLRDMEEIFTSMEKMSGKSLSEEEKIAFVKLNEYALSVLERRNDIEYLKVWYNRVIKNPKMEIEKVREFLKNSLDVENAIKAVEPNLYRNRNKEVKK